MTRIPALVIVAVISLAAADDHPAAPELFEPGVISTGEYETHPCFSPDGKTLYFLRSRPNFTGWTIMQSQPIDGRWSPPRVAPFSGKHADADPFITPDGLKLYFISDRPVDGQERDMDIWMMSRRADGEWDEPVRLPSPINSDANEWFPTIAADGTLYFGSERAGGKGGADLYRCRFANGKWSEPENLGDAVNSPASEFEPLIAPDQSFLIFMAAGRADGVGNGDLYISFSRNGVWTPATCLPPPINSKAQEIGAHLSRDGKTLYFSSARRIARDGATPRPANDDERNKLGPGNGLGDIYRIDMIAVPREPG